MKKITSMALCIALILSFFLLASCDADDQNTTQLPDATPVHDYDPADLSAIILPQGRYTSVTYIGSGLFSVQNSTNAKLVNIHGQVLIPFGDYRNFSLDCQGRIITTTRIGRRGLMNDDLEYLLQPRYAEIQTFFDGLFVAATYRAAMLTVIGDTIVGGDILTLYDTDFQPVFPQERFDRIIMPLSEDRIVVRSGRYRALVDLSGNYIISPENKLTDIWSAGNDIDLYIIHHFTVVNHTTRNFVGVMDLYGNEVIPINNFSEIVAISNNRFIVRTGQQHSNFRWALIDENENELIPFSNSRMNFSHGYVTVGGERATAVYDTDGNVVFPRENNRTITIVSDDRFILRLYTLNGQWWDVTDSAVVNLNGDFIVPFGRYSPIEHWGWRELIRVRNTYDNITYTAYIDFDGNYLSPMLSDWFWETEHEGLFLVGGNMEKPPRIIDSQGNTVAQGVQGMSINSSIDIITPDLFILSYIYWRDINPEDIPPNLSWREHEELTTERRAAVINANGEYVIPFGQYTEIDLIQNSPGFITVRNGEYLSVLNLLSGERQ